MLACLQSDIFNLVCRREGEANLPVNIESSDTSVSIHACHSPMRETQVLKDLLQNEFENNPGLQPHDIIVMMPDIETYTPFIESVFALEHTMPFSISARKKRSDSETIEAFLKVLALKNSRFERYQVHDLLLSEPIAQKFNIRPDELDDIEKMVDDSRILWGKDKNHRKILGLPPFEENTWHFGMSRLFMGMAMPENYETPVQNILPCQVLEGISLELLGKFAAFCDTLFSCLEMLEGEKTIEKWCRVLKIFYTLLMERNFKNSEDLTFLSKTIDQIQQDSSRAEYDHMISFDVFHAIIEHKLDKTISHGKFLSGNITFCNIMPMRSIPFKIVVLMGMDEHSFPRQVFSPLFDLMKKYPQPCDKNERHEDRYSFLETMLCARSKFIITYTGIGVLDNKKTPCSGVVSELIDTMEHSFNFLKNKNYRYHFFHPLHPFDQKYFIEGSRFFSFSQHNCTIAKILSLNRGLNHTFIPKISREDAKEPWNHNCGSDGYSRGIETEITLTDIIRFFQNPIQYYLREGMEIKIPEIEELAQEREDFSLTGLDKYILGSFLVEKKSKLQEKKDYYPMLKSAGSLPLGIKGKFEYDNTLSLAYPVIEAAQAILMKKQLPAIAGAMDIDKVTILENLSDINEDGGFHINFGKLNGSRLLSAWIKHLFFNITAPKDCPRGTSLIGRDPAGRKGSLRYQFSPLEFKKAFQYFSDLVKIYIKGIEQPFYFTSETSWQLVQILSKKSYNLDSGVIFKAMNNAKVKSSWYGGYYQAGEILNAYISLYFKNLDPFKSLDSLIDSRFVHNAVNVYRPMLEYMKVK
jgi:exodeoxyribonuclease V gamma subunit